MCGIWRSPPSDCLSCSNPLVLYPSFKRKRRLWSRLVLFISYFKWVGLVFISLYRTARKAHIIPLRRFLEAILHQDLRNFFSETCFEVRYALCTIVLGNVCSFLQLKIKLYLPQNSVNCDSSLSSVDWQKLYCMCMHAQGIDSSLSSVDWQKLYCMCMHAQSIDSSLSSVDWQNLYCMCIHAQSVTLRNL